jgi:thioredoxin 2
MIRNCPSCGKKNRVPAGHLADKGRCGACKAEIPPAGAPIEADGPTFREIVGESRVPVLVDFWAGWCAPCRMTAPEVERVAREMAGRALVLKVDTESEPALASEYGVASIPNFLVFRGGLILRQQPGAVPAEAMKSWLEAAGA